MYETKGPTIHDHWLGSVLIGSTLSGPQSRFGDTLLGISVRVSPPNGTAVLERVDIRVGGRVNYISLVRTLGNVNQFYRKKR